MLCCCWTLCKVRYILHQAWFEILLQKRLDSSGSVCFCLLQVKKPYLIFSRSIVKQRSISVMNIDSFIHSFSATGLSVRLAETLYTILETMDVAWMGYTLDGISVDCRPLRTHICMLIHTWGNFIVGNWPLACFWEVGGNQRTQRKLAQTCDRKRVQVLDQGMDSSEFV